MAVLFLSLLVDFVLLPEEGGGGGGGEEEGRVCDSLVCSVAVFLFFASVLYCCLLIKGQLIERERERKQEVYMYKYIAITYNASPGVALPVTVQCRGSKLN